MKQDLDPDLKPTEKLDLDLKKIIPGPQRWKNIHYGTMNLLACLHLKGRRQITKLWDMNATDL